MVIILSRGEWVRTKKYFTESDRRAKIPTMARKRRSPIVLHPVTRWRQAHDLSQHEVARACGLSQGFLGMIETYRRTPAHDNLEALIIFTGLPTDALVRPLRFLEAQPNFPYADYPPRPDEP